MRRGFTLLEVLLAAIILGSGLAAILVSMSQAQRMMLASSRQETAQEVMDLGEMAYPLADVLTKVPFFGGNPTLAIVFSVLFGIAAIVHVIAAFTEHNQNK